MAQLGKRQFIPFVITVVSIIFTDLLIGIGIGLVAAIVAILLDHYNKPFVDYQEDPKSGTYTLILPPDITFLHKAGIREALAAIPDGGSIVLDASNARQMDVDVRDIILDFETRAQQDSIEFTYHPPKTDARAEQPLKAFKKALLLSKEKS
jgi:MFS superfamily sulfate permease-like transporter